MDWVRCSPKVVFFGHNVRSTTSRINGCATSPTLDGQARQQRAGPSSVGTGELIAACRRSRAPWSDLRQHAVAPLIVDKPLDDHRTIVDERGADFSGRCLGRTAEWSAGSSSRF